MYVDEDSNGLLLVLSDFVDKNWLDETTSLLDSLTLLPLVLLGIMTSPPGWMDSGVDGADNESERSRTS